MTRAHPDADTDISAEAEQPLILNGAIFPVTPDLNFRMAFDGSIDESDAKAGMIGIVFNSAAGAEILRSTRLFEPTWRRLAKLTTDPAGFVDLPPMKNAAARLSYTDDIANRPT